MPTESVAANRWEGRVLRECSLMATYALQAGLAIDPKTVERVEAAVSAARAGIDPHVEALVGLHAELCGLITPATPLSLEATMQPAGPDGAAAGRSLPLLRRLLVVAIASLAAFVGLSLFPQVTGDPGAADVVHGMGLPLLLNELFFLSAGTLGAALALMLDAQQRALRATFDPAAETSYWGHLLVGAMGGLVLPGFVPVGRLAAGWSEPGALGPALAVAGGILAPMLLRLAQHALASAEASLERRSPRRKPRP
jgi:hypothetical protein